MGHQFGIQTAHNNKMPTFVFCTQTTAHWLTEQSFILSVKFDYPVTRQNFLVLATVHDCETDLLLTRLPPLNPAVRQNN